MNGHELRRYCELAAAIPPEQRGRFPVHEWVHGFESQYGIYLAHPTDEAPITTSLEGIGPALLQMKLDGDLDGFTAVGILDGFTGTWLVNPFARPRRR